MKRFKYKFSKLAKILIYIGIALCPIAFGLNIYFLITEDIASAAYPIYSIIKYVLMFMIPALLLVILVSLLVSSYYTVDGKTFVTSFGIIKSKYKISEIQTIVLDRTTNKLSLYFKDNIFIVVVVKEDWYDEFIDALCLANPDIEFSIKSKENSGKDDKDKKDK